VAGIKMGLRLLETLTSALYEDPIVLFREYIQNSVDAYVAATRDNSGIDMEDFYVDIEIDYENKAIRFADNGYGIELSKFEEYMRSIGKSDKGKYKDQIGFRGIGRLSALPFCDELIFRNKVKGSDKIQVFQWDGKKYSDLLLKGEDHELDAAMGEISKIFEYPYDGSLECHFFEVRIRNYSVEIVELLSTADFRGKLCLLLPLRYSPSFDAQGIVKQEYDRVMGKSLEASSFDIRLDGQTLYKPYEGRHILESEIVFWPLQLKPRAENKEPEKIGVLWFSFNRKVTANPTNEPRGIKVRSKNMLVGGEDSLADAVSVNSSDYVATYRELTQTLAGVYGEMLLYTDSLDDNARRDWFKIDASSIELRSIIAEFLRRLIAYRYAASRAFSDKSDAKKKEKLIKAYTELTQGLNQEQFLSDFYTPVADDKQEDIPPLPERPYEDIPKASITVKRFYSKVLNALEGYFLEERDLKSFIKIRAFLKKKLNEEQEK